MDDLKLVAADLTNAPIIIESDLAPPKAGTHLAERIMDAVEGVNILVNNAGIPMRH